MQRYCQTGPNRGEKIGEEEIIDAILGPIGLLRVGEIAVDLGAWDGFHLSNVRHLHERYGFKLKLFDGDGHGNPDVVKAWITAENVDALLRDNGVPQSPAVMSIDLDGNDYWIRKAITLTPALIIQEFQGTLDPMIPVTIPYDPNWTWKDGDGNYFGASWSAIRNLNESMGYRYVTQCGGLNAFFIREDLAHPSMPWNPKPPPVYKYHKFKAGPWLVVSVAVISKRFLARRTYRGFVRLLRGCL